MIPAMQAIVRSMALHTPKLTLSYLGLVEGNSQTLNVPGYVQPGDLGILFDAPMNASGIPTVVTPLYWTALATQAGVLNLLSHISYVIFDLLTVGQMVSGIAGTSNSRKQMLFFRPSRKLTGVRLRSYDGTASDLAISTHTIDMTDAQTTASLGIAFARTNTSAVSWSAHTPAADGTATMTSQGSTNSVKWTIRNDIPSSDISVSLSDGGTDNILQTFFLDLYAANDLNDIKLTLDTTYTSPNSTIFLNQSDPGDWIICIDTAESSGSPPNAVLPTDWTLHLNTAGAVTRCMVYSKIMDDNDLSHTGMTGSVNTKKIILAYRPTRPIKRIRTAQAQDSVSLTGDPSQLLLDLSNSSTNAGVALAIYRCQNPIDAAPTYSPAGGETTRQYDTTFQVKHRTLTSSPPVTTIDMPDEGSDNILQAVILECEPDLPDNVEYVGFARAPATGTPFTDLPLPSGIRSGDLLLAVVSKPTNSTDWIVPEGWVIAFTYGSTPAFVLAWTVVDKSGVVNTAGFTDLTSGGVKGALVVAYRGLRFDLVASTATTGANPLAAGAITPRALGRLLGLFLRDADDVNIPAPSGMTPLIQFEADPATTEISGVLAEEIILSTASTGTRTATMGSATSVAGLLMNLSVAREEPKEAKFVSWSKTDSAGVQVSSIVLSLPKSIQEGDLLVYVVGADSATGANWTPPAGWVESVDSNTGVALTTAWKVYNEADTTAISVGISVAARLQGHVLAFRNGAYASGSGVFSGTSPQSTQAASTLEINSLQVVVAATPAAAAVVYENDSDMFRASFGNQAAPTLGTFMRRQAGTGFGPGVSIYCGTANVTGFQFRINPNF